MFLYEIGTVVFYCRDGQNALNRYTNILSNGQMSFCGRDRLDFYCGVDAAGLYFLPKHKKYKYPHLQQHSGNCETIDHRTIIVRP